MEGNTLRAWSNNVVAYVFYMLNVIVLPIMIFNGLVAKSTTKFC